MDINRVLSGTPEHKKELIAAGVVAGIWFLMDFVQWIDWLVSKFSVATVVCK
jgi:hypothetical protein